MQRDANIPGNAATGTGGDVRHWWILQFPVETGSRFTGGLAMDITERRRAEEALRHSEERYALAAHSANDGLFDWNLKSGEVYFSARWKSMLGHEENEVGTSPDEWFKRVHPEDLPIVKESVDAHLEGRSPSFECEHRMRHKERGYRWVGDVDYDAALDVAGAITQVPGGVGPMTITMLLHNTMKAAWRLAAKITM